MIAWYSNSYDDDDDDDANNNKKKVKKKKKNKPLRNGVRTGTGISECNGGGGEEEKNTWL